MIGPDKSYKLETILNQYEQYIGEDKENKNPQMQEEKEKLGNMAMNIIAMGANKLNEAQKKALLDFSSRLSITNPDDRVVQMASAISKYILMNEQLESKEIPSDIKAVVDSYIDIPNIENLPKETKQKVASYAITNILMAGTDDSPINYADLVQFTKILSICWNEPYLKKNHEALVHQLLFLLDKTKKPSSKEASEFAELSTTLIKEHEGGKVPSDISGHPGYHGKALEQGISTLQSMLKQTGKTMVSLQNFAEQYCNDHLKPHEYLIRNSSTVPSTDSKGVKYFTVTISYKRKNNAIEHARLTRQEKEGKVSWRFGAPPFNPEEKVKTFNNMNDAIKAIALLRRYKVAVPPSPPEINHYINTLYSKTM